MSLKDFKDKITGGGPTFTPCEGGFMVRNNSMFTGKTREVFMKITQEQIDARNAGALIQVAFPNLTPEEREFIMTGIYNEEWEKGLGKPR